MLDVPAHAMLPPPTHNPREERKHTKQANSSEHGGVVRRRGKLGWPAPESAHKAEQREMFPRWGAEAGKAHARGLGTEDGIHVLQECVAENPVVAGVSAVQL